MIATDNRERKYLYSKVPALVTLDKSSLLYRFRLKLATNKASIVPDCFISCPYSPLVPFFCPSLLSSWPFSSSSLLFSSPFSLLVLNLLLTPFLLVSNLSSLGCARLYSLLGRTLLLSPTLFSSLLSSPLFSARPYSPLVSFLCSSLLSSRPFFCSSLLSSRPFSRFVPNLP